MATVTRDSLQALLDNPNEQHRMHVIGRALVRVYAMQTPREQNCSDTIEENGEGFTGADGRYGSWCAKLYKNEGRLAPKTVAKWYKKSSKTGYSRIAKYHRQLNDAVKCTQQGSLL